MDSLGLFTLTEEYIAKVNYKIDEVDQLIAASQSKGCALLLNEMNRLSYYLKVHKVQLESFIDDIEYENSSDAFFIGHHNTNANTKIKD